MVRSSFIAGLTSVLSCGYNCYLVYNSPRFLTLDKVALKREAELTALYWSAAHTQQDVHEDLADEIIDIWFEQGRISSWWNPKTLSQLGLTR